jgi:NAD(P)-dependent dehydrogenase (short-subunit alcohol dehydrogenase family)
LDDRCERRIFERRLISMEKSRKTIIVTGAAGGLGRAFALNFAKRGAAVAAVDLADCSKTVALIKEAGGECISVNADVTKESSVSAMCAEVGERLGGIDGLVN